MERGVWMDIVIRNGRCDYLKQLEIDTRTFLHVLEEIKRKKVQGKGREINTVGILKRRSEMKYICMIVARDVQSARKKTKTRKKVQSIM